MSAFKLLVPLAALAFVLLSSGCATTPKEKIIQNMAIAGVVGAVVGATQRDYPSGYALMYGGLAAAASGAISVCLYDDSDSDKYRKETIRLQSQLDQLQPKVIAQGNSLFSSPLPREVSSLIQPGEWKRLKMDQWVQDQNDPNTWVRQTEMFVVTPPAAR